MLNQPIIQPGVKTMNKATEIRYLLRLAGEAYKDRAWHGANLRGSIKGLSPAEAAWRPGRNRHSIQEIVVHAAYWKYVIRRRILGEKKGSFRLKGSNWFGRPGKGDPAGWKKDTRLLDEMHDSMCKAIATLRPDDLGKKFPGSRFDFLSSIIGIACHDVYHTGQIQLLKRLMKK
jgi:hypothetical protein